jgi:flagellar secretion chaperone FliS
MTTDAEIFDPAHAEMLRRRYLATQVETATAEQRLMMLFDRLMRDLDDAEQGLTAGAIEPVNSALRHAQDIVFALRDPLDRSSELGQSLYGVYSYCLERLIEANLQKRRSPLIPAREMLEAIAQANRRAASALIAGQADVHFEGVA